MLNHFVGRFRWRITRAHVRRRATSFIHQHGEAAFFRAHDAVWIARGMDARAEAAFWEAVAREVARQMQRGAMLASIMQPSGLMRSAEEGGSASGPPAREPDIPLPIGQRPPQADRAPTLHIRQVS
jgi:hypothetical protein